MDQINADMKLAEQALRSMDLLCGIFPKFWKKSGGFKEDDAVWGDQKVRESWFIIQSGVRCNDRGWIEVWKVNQYKSNAVDTIQGQVQVRSIQLLQGGAGGIRKRQ